MKKLILLIIVLSVTLFFINCHGPSEGVNHIVTLTQGQEFDFQLNPVTKWDTLDFGLARSKPEYAEYYTIYKKEGNPPYYHFLYVADNDYVGEDYAEIEIKRNTSPGNDQFFYHNFYFTIVAPELP
jgi:hypothetical protein